MLSEYTRNVGIRSESLEGAKWKTIRICAQSHVIFDRSCDQAERTSHSYRNHIHDTRGSVHRHKMLEDLGVYGVEEIHRDSSHYQVVVGTRQTECHEGTLLPRRGTCLNYKLRDAYTHIVLLSNKLVFPDRASGEDHGEGEYSRKLRALQITRFLEEERSHLTRGKVCWNMHKWYTQIHYFIMSIICRKFIKIMLVTLCTRDT